MRETRKAMKVSQAELARLVGVNQSTISDIESGVIPISKVIPAIAVALYIPPPFVPIEHRILERWLRAGQNLLAEGEDHIEAALRFLESQAQLLHTTKPTKPVKPEK